MKRRIAILAGGVMAATVMVPAANAMAMYAQVKGYVSADTISNDTIARAQAWSNSDVYAKYTRSASPGTDRALYNKSGKGTIVQSGSGSRIIRIKACHPITGPDDCSAWVSG
jgi:hypothetical protein